MMLGMGLALQSATLAGGSGGGGEEEEDDMTIARVTVSSAEILAIDGTPKTLVAAPGAGKFIDVVSVRPMLAAGTPYNMGATVFVRYDGGQTIIEAFGITNGSDEINFSPILLEADGGGSFGASDFENKAVTLTSDDPITDGNGTMTFEMRYYIVDLP